MTASAFSAYLRRCRKAANHTQRELADLTGIHFTYISKLETGAASPPAVTTLYRLADAVGVPVADMCAAAGRIDRDMSKKELEGYALELRTQLESLTKEGAA